MKRFKFRLEAVLRVRRIQEEQARAALQRANKDVADAIVEVDHRAQRYTTLERPAGPQAHDEIEKIWFALDAAAAGVQYARQQVIDARAVAEAKHGEWSQAEQRVRALEKLRDRARAEHNYAVQHEEHRMNDDLATIRHLSRTGDR